MRSKFFIVVMAVFGIILLGSAINAHAASDTCLISMSPPTSFAVRIDTPSAGNGFSFGNVKLNTVYISSAPTVGISTVTNSGEVVADWKIRADDAAGWYLDDTNANKDTVGTDTATLCAIITTVATAPSDIDDGDFHISDDLLKNSPGGTDGEMNSDQYNDGGTDGDDVGAGEQRRLWIRLKTPDNTTTIDAQQFRMYIETYAPSEF
jgi:hypothetical protein